MNQIIRWMVGRDLPEPKIRNVEKGALALKVSNDAKGTAVRDVSFELHRGEILGFAGLMGSGRTETMRASFGADRMEGGSVIVQYNKQRQGLINK